MTDEKLEKAQNKKFKESYFSKLGRFIIFFMASVMSIFMLIIIIYSLINMVELAVVLIFLLIWDFLS